MIRQQGMGIVLLLIQTLLFSAQSWAEDIQRIVSLDLCTDWMLLRYASPSLQVTYSPLLYRFQADWVSSDLPVHDGSLEQILELKSDLIISGEFNASLLRKRLHQLGKNTQVMTLPLSLQSIIEYTDKFKSLVQTNGLLNKLPGIKKYKSKNAKLLLLGANGIGTGTGTVEHDVLEKSGWHNYLQAAGFVSLDLESLVIDPPDALLWSKPISNSLANFFSRHPALRGIQSKKVVKNGWKWQCPGPWTFDLVSELATWEIR